MRSTSWSFPSLPFTVAHGDSITLGCYDNLNPYPSQLSALIWATGTKDGTVANYGCNSIGFNQSSADCGTCAVAGTSGTLLSNAAALVDPIVFKNPNAKLVIFAGTNDIWIGGSTAAQTLAFSNSYISARIAAGWKPGNIIVATMLPRYNSLQTPAVNASLEATRQTYISGVVAASAGQGVILARLDQDPNIGQAGDSQNLTYYEPDQIHPNAAGVAIITSIIFGVYP